MNTGGMKMKKRLISIVITIVFVILAVAFIPVEEGTASMSTNTVIDVKNGGYTPVLIHNGMTDVASVGAYAQAKGAFVAINATYFNAYATEGEITSRGGDVNPLRIFGPLYGVPLNFPSGVLVSDGKLVHGAGYGTAAGQWGGYLGGITKQGEFIVDQVTLNIGFIVDGNRSTVWRVNHPSYEATSVALYDGDFGHDVQLKQGDKAVVVQGEVITGIVSAGPVRVPSGGFVVVAASSANVFYGNRNIDSSFSVGQQASWTWEVNSPRGYNFKDVYLAVGSDVAKINGSGGSNRSYIGGTADGRISIGVGTASECVNALFLDGGGSIAYYKDGRYLNGPGRNVSNAIGFVRVGQGGNVPALTPTPAPAPPANMVNPTPSKVFVNGAEKNFEAYNISGSNYFKLRDLAFVLSGTNKQFDVGYDNSTRAITITTGRPYTTAGGEMAAGDGRAKAAGATQSEIYIDGRKLDFTVYNIGGNNFFRLRDLMSALDIGVTYDSATQNIGIDTNLPYTDSNTAQVGAQTQTQAPAPQTTVNSSATTSITATGQRGNNNQVFSYIITGSTSGTVWGSRIYTDDSNIAKSAVHAGLVAVGETATVTIRILPGQSSYSSTTANGITTSSYGSWSGSYEFVR
jgi:exopolysaccharide biosynthesis protein